MKTLIILPLLMICFSNLSAQKEEPSNPGAQGGINQFLNREGRLLIGGYGEVHFNQPLSSEYKQNGVLDVHRMVLFLGYNFSGKTQFVTEIEFEYAKELWVEQMFLQHRFLPWLNLRAGLLLIPMGIINETHEPTTFNGVERPMVDNRIVPSTWREIGFGFAGKVPSLPISYQLYLVNGPSGHDGKALFAGEKGIREGRQKGSKSYIHSPSLSGKLEYSGINGLLVGLSGYSGRSQSRLLNRIPSEDAALMAEADSSRVFITMLGADARYNHGNWEFRGQYIHTWIGNSSAYNIYHTLNGTTNDLGSQMMGYYIEGGYDLLGLAGEYQTRLIAFVRYESVNTHYKTEAPVQMNHSFNSKIITTGLSCKLHPGAVLKADLQFTEKASGTGNATVFNAGIGFSF